MEIVNAYELVGSYRGAAELCGTTHKTVKRVIERREVGQAERRVVQGFSATDVPFVQATFCNSFSIRLELLGICSGPTPASHKGE